MEKINLSNSTLNKLRGQRYISSLIQQANFIGAYNEAKKIQSTEERNNYISRINSECKNYIKKCFEQNGTEECKLLFKNLISNYIPEYIEDIKTFYESNVEFYTIREILQRVLEQYDFKKADCLLEEYADVFDIKNYELLKCQYIQKFFKEKFNIDINHEQAIALSKTAQNVLVKARAGSGKTRTIACRAIYAIEKENLKPEEILILAFNKDAAKEIQERINKNFNYKKFNPEFSRTFHGLACKIAGCIDREILYNDSNKYSKHNLTNFVERLYHSENIWNEDFKNKLYYFYKADDDLVFDDEYWSFDSQEEKYRYLRSKTFYTLNGEKVKSFGEKYIANFLFEHNIPYKYEKPLMQKNYKLYKPDFTIFYNGGNYILEHWGIDENDPLKSVPEYWDKNWDEYYNEMIWKRNLLSSKKQNGEIANFLETSIVNLNNGYAEFERFLKITLENVGISCKKLSHQAILKKMEDAHKFDKMAEKFVSFIQFAKLSRITPVDIAAKLKTINLSERSKTFIELANNIYREYDKELEKQNKTDFNNILEEAIYKIKSTKGNCEITLGKEKYKIKNLKFIMIDEYQDFSRLFFELIQAIKLFNPDLKLFCVGDDWQAINGFAGSNLKYFDEFTTIFKESDVANLLYNYRSAEKIVNLSNSIMKGRGIPAKCFNNIEATFLFSYIDGIKWNIDEDQEFMYEKENSNFFGINHRYLKKCFEIISENPNKSFFIMHRTNNINYYHQLDKFKDALLFCLKLHNIVADITVDTIHKFKGREADCVIILEFGPDYFPLVHPDNEFCFILNRTPQMILDEERRLLYVAITRAKKGVYLLCEKQKLK